MSLALNLLRFKRPKLNEAEPSDVHAMEVDPRTDPAHGAYTPEVHGDKNHPLYDPVYAAYRSGAIANLPDGTLPVETEEEATVETLAS